jgi:hypothetical protein
MWGLLGIEWVTPEKSTSLIAPMPIASVLEAHWLRRGRNQPQRLDFSRRRQGK